MYVDRPVGVTDRAEAEVTSPAAEYTVEFGDHLGRFQTTVLSARDRVDPLAHSRDPFLASMTALRLCAVVLAR